MKLKYHYGVKFDEKHSKYYIQRQWYGARHPGLHLLVPSLSVIENISKIYLENMPMSNKMLKDGGDWLGAPDPGLHLLEWLLSGLLVASLAAVGLLVNVLCIAFT